jgi:hypothetical protein
VVWTSNPRTSDEGRLAEPPFTFFQVDSPPMSDILAVLAEAGFDVDGAVVTPLSGGVSCTTEHVRMRNGDVVVKQALDRLLVEAQWHADPGRTVAEGLGLAWLHALTPEAVPEPLAIIEQPPTIVIPMAPEPCPDWRQQLLGHPTERDVRIAAQLRSVADIWHGAPVTEARGTPLDDVTRVTDLRIDPFYLDMAARWPAFAPVIERCADELRVQSAMTHGDFTPKNVLCLDDGVWVIDAEITHIGNPILDIASMMTHLLLKSVVHRGVPTDRAMMERIRRAFDTPEFTDVPTLPLHIGVILGVRCAGVSPALYLDEESRIIVADMAQALLHGATIDEIEHRFGLTA